MHTIIKGSYTAKISPYPRGYKCLIVDRLGNDVEWHLHAQCLNDAIAEVNRHFKHAINYLRGFVTLHVFLDQVSESTERAIIDLDDKYPNAIAIFGGARLVQNIDDIVGMLPTVVRTAKFFQWHETPANTCRTFCTLCFIDPALVECFIGTKFEKIFKEF